MLSKNPKQTKTKQTKTKPVTATSLKLVHLTELQNQNILKVYVAGDFFFFCHWSAEGAQYGLNICIREVNEDWMPSHMLFGNNDILY